MKNKKLLFFSALFLFLGFLFFTFLVSLNHFNRLDIQTTEVLQKIIPRYLDIPFSLFSLIGSFEVVLLILLLLWAIRRNLNHFYVLIFFGVFHITEIIGKLFVNHPNPPFKFFRYDIPFSMPSSGINTGYSFPSGHMGRTMFMATILFFLIYNSGKLSKFQKKLLYCLITFVVGLMFVSRIYLGEHWLSDVIGGSLLGVAMGLISALFFL